MGESQTHKDLLVKICKWIKSSDETAIILCDEVDAVGQTDLPPMINDVRPDVYAIGRARYRYIIGEAKASQSDLESEHTIKQLTAYIEFCVSTENSVLVVAVPVMLINCTKNLIRNLKNRLGANVETYVLDINDHLNY